MQSLENRISDITACFIRGDFASAERDSQALLAANPEAALAWKLYGAALQSQEKDCLEPLRKAETLLPSDPAVKALLGAALTTRGKHDEARTKLREALALDKDCAQAHFNLGLLCVAERDHAGAIPHFRIAASLPGTAAAAYAALGSAASHAGRTEEAEQALRTALALNPKSAEANYTLSTVLLSQGKYRDGFALFEHRWGGRSSAPPQTFTYPAYTGRENIDGKKILVWSEQGIGDTIQFMPFAKTLEEREAIVSLGVRPAMHRLALQLGLSGEVYSGQCALPHFDMHCAVMSLANRLGTTIDTIPLAAGYLPRNDKRANNERLKVGIAWQGNPEYLYDWKRSIRLNELKQIFNVPNVEFVSIQKPILEPDKAAAEELRLHQLIDDNFDLLDTARAIEQLDLVIAVDSGMAHLAGAMGIPTWIMLHEFPDWRWLEERTDSPWYRSMTLWRRAPGEGWEDVAERIGLALEGAKDMR